MKENQEDDLELNDDDLYANFDAFKALIDVGISRSEALKRTGLTEQIVRDLEIEEEEMNLRSEFEEKFDKFDDDDDGFGEEKWDDDEDSWDDDEGGFGNDYYDEDSYGSSYDEF
ncbi:MAG: hypothetical protein SNJ77_07380 [Cytophagales bacterium]